MLDNSWPYNGKLKLQRVLQMLLGLYFVNVLLIMLLPSYKNYSAISALSFNTTDGWCKNGQGIGTHCFGDFYYNFNFSNLETPWSDEPYPYPPLSVFIFKLFKILFDHSSLERLSLNTYLTVSILAMLFPCFHLLKTKRIDKRLFFVLSAATLSSSPMIMSFDRGNLQMIMTPFIYLCIYHYISKNNKWFLISSSILIALKPQYILLGILLTADRDIKNLVKWFVTITLTFFATFLLFPKSILQNVQDFFQQIETFNHYVPLGNLYPANLSISSTFSLIYRFFSVNSNENMTLANNLYIPFWITAALLIFCVFLFWKMGQFANRYKLLYVAICLPLLLPGVSFAYHTSSLMLLFFFIGVKIYFDIESSNQKDSPHYFLEEKFTLVLTFLILALVFIPWSIPWNIIPYYANLSDGNMTITWTILQLLVLILFIKTIVNISTSKKGEK